MLSIVIPTLNEADNIGATIEQVRTSSGAERVEIVVADCDSRDGTVAVARGFGVHVITGCRHRADALNRGAAATSGKQLLFLHADSKLPPGFTAPVDRALRDPTVVGGAFDFKFRSHELNHGLNRRLLQFVAICNRIRFRRSRAFFGDQGIFVRRSVFDRLGGFPNVPLLEDLRFSLAMSRQGATAILSPPIRTSPRRFVSRGVVRQFAQDVFILSCESCGVYPRSLWQQYNLPSIINTRNQQRQVTTRRS